MPCPAFTALGHPHDRDIRKAVFIQYQNGPVQLSGAAINQNKAGNDPLTCSQLAVAALEYLLHGRKGAAPDRSVWTATRNLPDPDPEKAAAVMRATANASTRTKKPVYHLSVSLAPGERLERAELEQVADRLLQDLGLADHQALVAEHADGAQQHIHLLVNRVRSETGRAWGELGTGSNQEPKPPQSRLSERFVPVPNSAVGMEVRSGGGLEVGGLGVRVLFEDCLPAQGLATGLLDLIARFFFDLADEGAQTGVDAMLRLVAPAGARGDVEREDLGEA